MSFAEVPEKKLDDVTSKFAGAQQNYYMSLLKSEGLLCGAAAGVQSADPSFVKVY